MPLVVFMITTYAIAMIIVMLIHAVKLLLILGRFLFRVVRFLWKFKRVLYDYVKSKRSKEIDPENRVELSSVITNPSGEFDIEYYYPNRINIEGDRTEIYYHS